MKTYNIFISHAWKYSDDYERVLVWLDRAKSERRLMYRIFSDPKDDPIDESEETVKTAKMKDVLRKQILLSSLVIVIMGEYANTRHSEWTDFEISAAVEMEKYIIGLEPWGQKIIPAYVMENADVRVGWSYEPLIRSILNSRI